MKSLTQVSYKKNLNNVFQTIISVLKKNILLKNYLYLKNDKNYVGSLCIKNPFYMFIKTLNENLKKLPQNIPKTKNFFLLKVVSS
jgi:hypothetical protein